MQAGGTVERDSGATARVDRSFIHAHWPVRCERRAHGPPIRGLVHDGLWPHSDCPSIGISEVVKHGVCLLGASGLLARSQAPRFLHYSKDSFVQVVELFVNFRLAADLAQLGQRLAKSAGHSAMALGGAQDPCEAHAHKDPEPISADLPLLRGL